MPVSNTQVIRISCNLQFLYERQQQKTTKHKKINYSKFKLKSLNLL